MSLGKENRLICYLMITHLLPCQSPTSFPQHNLMKFTGSTSRPPGANNLRNGIGTEKWNPKLNPQHEKYS